MIFLSIPDGDSLFRHCVHPLAFKKKGLLFSPEKFVKLYDVEGSILASVAWERYAPTSKEVHEYGCRLAAGINEKASSEAKFRDSDRKIYCGAYQLSASSIRALAVTEGLDEIASADVVHHIENGEIAHTDLRIVLKNTGGDFVEGTKTAILDRLWHSCYGPLTHICTCDLDMGAHPTTTLLVPPSGSYSDQRSSLCRRWYLVRYRICNWVWKKFIYRADTSRS
jgi:hypothetical protein